MKRSRKSEVPADSGNADEEDEYLELEEEEVAGGGGTSVVSFDTEQPIMATKAEAKERRKQSNKLWKTKERFGEDPNSRHSLYYKQQLLELNEEWSQFTQTMCRPLNVTFRVCMGRDPLVARVLTARFLGEFRDMAGRFVEVRGVVVAKDVVTAVSWIPGAFSIAADSATLGSASGLAGLSQLLKREARLGNLVRQELVSMIPARLLAVKCDHAILDICAAPGSKTEQLLSLMQVLHPPHHHHHRHCHHYPPSGGRRPQGPQRTFQRTCRCE